MSAKPVLRTAVSFLAITAIAALAAGCGSEPLGGYQQRVGEINRESAELLAEAAHLMEESGHEAHGGAASLEELVEELRAAALELSTVKVPAGLEGFQEDLLALYGGTVSTLEGLLSTLQAGASEGEPAHGGEGDAEHESGEEAAHEEKPSHGEEEAQKDVTPGSPGVEAGSGGESHTGTGH